MKLTIIRLDNLTSQDLIDLQKIWPQTDSVSLHKHPEDKQLYVARFNARLLAAVWLQLTTDYGELSELCVREVTRLRGVGSYLLEEVMANNPSVRDWRIVENNPLTSEAKAFLLACGFHKQEKGWVKSLSS